MRKVHLISVTEPLIFDLALAIREKGYEVTVSGESISDSIFEMLREKRCRCYGEGWFPEKLTKDINFVVLGASVRKDNPELLKAKELGLLIQSVPEFIFHRTKSKTRVVIAGAQGKKSIIAMIAYTLDRQNLKFDYALTSDNYFLSNRIRMSYESRIAIIEGDAQITSNLEKRFLLEFYRPHIAVISNLLWDECSVHATPEDYYNVYRSFISSVERQGKLIYYSEDEILSKLAVNVRDDITAMPYKEHEVIEGEGGYFLQTRYGEFHINMPDNYFLVNLNAARLVCRQLGVKDANFYQAISEYSLSLLS